MTHPSMNPSPRVLILSTVWPEPNSSAAGVRQVFWIDFFRKWGWEVFLASASQLKTPGMWGHYEAPPGVTLVPVELNRTDSFKQFAEINPSLVMFDRFLLEEQFGHAVHEHCPNAVWVIETQDLHFVRKVRETLVSKMTDSADLNALELYEGLHLRDEALAIRESASIYRADSSIVISQFEKSFCEQTWGIRDPKIFYVPFLWEDPVLESAEAWREKEFQKRSGFSFVANFRHIPNLDGLLWFARAVWPLIRKKIPSASIQVYGAYMPAQITQLHNEKNGFLVKGAAENLEEVFGGVRVNVAPLRSGAGVKGKVLEGFRRGIPCVATPIASEGLCRMDFEFPGLIAGHAELFAENCVKLHEDEEIWLQAQARAKLMMSENHGAKDWKEKLQNYFEQLIELRREGKIPDWQSKVLRSELANSRKYFSKWIEEKERPSSLPR